MTKGGLNPWLTMWYKPRQTMRFILENYPRRLIHTLAIAGAFTHIAGSSSFYWYSWWSTVLIWIVLSIITGLVTLYVLGGLIKWTGNWLKGSATMQEILSAIAWSQVPVLYFFVIDIAILALVGWSGLNLVYTTFRFLFAVWGFVIFLACLEEVQRYNFFKALINYILAIVILFVFLVLVNLIIGFFVRPDAGCAVQTTVQKS